MPLQSSKGKEPESGGKFLSVHNTANLGQGLGAGGGAGGGSGDQFKMQQRLPEPLNPTAGITTHNSLNTNNFPFRWVSPIGKGPLSGPIRGPGVPAPNVSPSTLGGGGTMFKFTSEFNGKIRAYLWGGGGGGAPGNGGKGGAGGFAQADITVTNGQTLWVVVGEGGGEYFNPTEPSGNTWFSPWGNRHGSPGSRGSGGGFSAILVGSDPTCLNDGTPQVNGNCVLVAGGGGGAGGSPTSGPGGSPGGGMNGSPDDGQTGPGHARGGDQVVGGVGGSTGGRPQGGQGYAFLGGGHPASPLGGSNIAGAGGGYYGGGGAGDNMSTGGGGGSGYIGGHPTAPVTNAKWGIDDSPNNYSWPGKPGSVTAIWPELVGPIAYLQGGCGTGGYGGSPQARTNGMCGRVIIEVLNPE